MKTLEEKIVDLKCITKTQCSRGNYDQSEYMRGMANGMILSVATMEGTEPKYFNKP